jgi:DNA-binding MarR family transcriptional regulator
MRALLDLQITRDLSHDSGLSDADYDVLSNLSESTGHRMRLTELAGLMLWTNSRLSHQITRMEQRGLVARKGDPTDARGAVVVLTRSGWAAIRKAAPPHVDSVRTHFIDLLTDQQLRVLGDLSEKVIQHLARSEPTPKGSTQRQHTPTRSRTS